jgi:AcrR family transcriptional regulator
MTLSSDLNSATARYQEKREALLDAAARLFNNQGVKGTTLSSIAASVGLITNSVTYYYRRKEDLARACFLRSIDALDALARAAAAEPGVAERVRSFFARYAQQLADIEQGRHVQLVNFNDIRALPSPHAEEVFAAYTDMFRRIRRLLKGEETAHLSRDDLNARTHIVVSIAHWVRSWIGSYEADEYLRMGDRVSDILLRGLAGAGATWLASDGERDWRLATGSSGAPEAFLSAATVLVNEQGYRGASVDKISARLNVTKGSFYHHNDTKHDLITECFERTFSVVRQALRLAEAGSGSGWQRACAATRALVRFQLTDAGPLLRTTAISALPDEEHREQVRQTMYRLTERMANLVVDGMMDGSIRPLDAAIAARAVFAAINAAAELHRWLPGATVDNVAEVYVRPIFEGVLCRGSAGT